MIFLCEGVFFMMRLLAYLEFWLLAVMLGQCNTPDYSTAYTYDLNGNITSLQRKGLARRELADTYELWTFGEVDNVAMTYDGNQLRQINDATEEVILSSTMDVNDRENYNLHDANGNLLRCPDKDILYIDYNRMNLPDTIYFENNNRIIFKYDARGRKLSEIYKVYHFGYPPSLELEPLTINEPQSTSGYYTIASRRDYCGNYIYQNGNISMIITPAGYISGSMRYYYLRDYQGNNCVVLNQNGVVQQINHYYPYGSLMGEVMNTSSQPYRYGGKELVTLGGLNLSDFGARWLDSPSGTFTTMDPLCEDFQHLSPYLYCAGNPIKYIDPSGMESKAFFYSNQNPLLKKAAKSYRNTPDVQIFAHGNSKGISPIVNEEVVRITEASELVEFISKNYTDFKGITIDSEVVIVLHSCNTGTGEDSFAKKVSEEMKNATIVAPTGKVIVNELFGEVGVFDKDKERKEWVVYKGGKEITRLPSYTQPGSEGNTINIWNYIKMLIYELVK